jgi:hypothetical protein
MSERQQSKKMKGEVEVLPLDTPGGAGGIRTPYLLTASLFETMPYSNFRYKTVFLCFRWKLHFVRKLTSGIVVFQLVR